MPKRLNLIISRDLAYVVEGATMAYSLEQALEIAKNYDQNEIFVIGGGQVFEQAISFADRLYLTIVHTKIEGDAFFPDYSDFTKVVDKKQGESSGYKYTFMVLERSKT